MGSQTFEILRQGVWASLTGGWFYDPHQTVFCNVIHLYLWLFLLCGPFLTYLYFPTTFLTWTIYCFVTTLTVTALKTLNMALHLLYDKAQTVSDSTFKIDTKSTKIPIGDECGIEMQVIGNDVPSRISIEQPINEVSEANSMLSLDHVTSTIDLKVDVHRKNSSESSDSVSMYPPSIYHQSNDSNQQSQRIYLKNLQSSQNQLTETGQAAVLIKERELSRRYSDNLQKAEKSSEIPSQYSMPIFKDYAHNSMLVKHNPLRNRQHNRNFSQGQEFLSEIWKNTQLNNVQTSSPKAVSCSLYQIKPVQEATLSNNSKITTLDTENVCYNEIEETKCKNRGNSLEQDSKIELPMLVTEAEKNEYENKTTAVGESLNSEIENITGEYHTISTDNNDFQDEKLSVKTDKENKFVKKNNITKTLQRHRSTESHEENQHCNNRNCLFKNPSHQNRDHTTLSIVDNNTASSTLQLTMIQKQDSLQQKNPKISSHHPNLRLNDIHLRSSYMYLSNNYTKSDLDIEQFEENLGDGSDSKDVHSLVLLKQKNAMRKDSNSTMSALQLPIAASVSNLDQQQNQNKRRHSNTSCKPGSNDGGGSSGAISSRGPQSSNVRRIKSTALDVACPQPSVSNLSPHPNSTEAIAGQQLKFSNPPLLPPPSKCLVRNQHLTFCSKFNENILNKDDCGIECDTDCYNENFDAAVYPISEHVEKSNELNIKYNLCSMLVKDKNCEENQIGVILYNHEIDENIDHEDNSIIEKENGSENFDNINCSNSCNNNDESNDKVNKFNSDNNDDLEDVDDDEVNDSNDVDNNDNIYCNNDNDNLDAENPLELKPSSNTTESESEIERPRTQSTDSETDNNGSRSPLLNKDSRENSKVKILEQQPKTTQIGNEKFNKNIKKNKCFVNNFNMKDVNKSNVDSGCPSSDYEQVSSSSKDMLLHSAEKAYTKIEQISDKTYISREKEDKTKILNECTEPPRGLNIAQEEADIENLRLKDAKSLGAIPKTGLRRCSEIPIASGMGAPMGMTNFNAISTKRSIPKSMSRTSSSASSRSFSAESFSNDVYKTYRDRYSFVLGQDVSQGFTLNSAHQGGFCSVRRNFNENLGNFRLKHRFNITDPDNTGNAAGIGNGRDILIGGTANSKLDENIDFGSDDLQKTHETATTLSIQGLINEQYSFENSFASTTGEQRHNRHRPTRQSSAGAILNVEINDSIYCDYWRPCRLSAEKPVQPKKFYKYRWKFLGRHELKITMDRLQLLALFDRDLNWFHVILAIILSSLTCFLGSYILQLELYKDIFAFGFCVVIAGSQYSLLKSVQPDAASPIHGFNKTVAYSRPIYFCLCSCLLIFSFQLNERFKTDPKYEDTDHINLHNVEFFGITFALNYIMGSLTKFLSIILLLFPIFFSLGLFPQVNTFCMYLLEQIDMHVFGGNAVCSLLSSIICILKSLIAVSILYGPAFGGLSEEKGTQHFLFSFFCSLLIPIAYHLSRSASDFSHIWTLIKSGLANTIPDDDDDDNIDEEEKIISKKSIKTGSSVDIDEKSNQAQIADSSTKATTSPSSDITCDDLRINMKQESNQSTVENGETGDLSQQSKTICSTDLKLDASEDKSDLNNHAEENELSTETLDSNSILNGIESEQADPLPKKLQATVNSRLKNDLVVSTILAILVLGLHCSTVFTVLQPDLNTVLYIMAALLGFILHYILPQMRKHMPWLCFAGPILRQKEFGQFEVSNAAKVMWFEAIYVCFCFLERNVLYPLIFISALTADSQNIAKKFGTSFGALIVSICSLKCVRNAYSDPANQYLILIFSVLLFKLDFNYANETFLLNFFVVSILFKKSCDFLLKLQFIVTYIAPWQITWGSAFHAFAQPFSVPHSAMLFLQAALSAILSTPLNPFLGSAIFLTSYVRPIKFWERDYNTRRIDHSNTRLSSQLERDLGADDNNLNSIFYEHLTRSLQHSLCGDLLLGRWGNVNQGDCFVLASDYLNCLVHIIELGNGLCTFQMRGLEFRGTYCQQREVEAISEGVEDNDACCCCNPGHIPKMLSANAMFSTRWLAWQVVAAQYVLEGYSISENLATATLQPFEFRKVLITYYIKSIIYYVTKNSKLDKWLACGPIQDSLSSTLSRQFVDLDPIFNYNLDEDFDFRALGITRSSFCSIYLNWIQLCYKKRKDSSSGTNLPSTEVLSTNVSSEQKLPSDVKNVNQSVDNIKDEKLNNEHLSDTKKSDKSPDCSYINFKSGNSNELKLNGDNAFCETREMNIQSLLVDSGNDTRNKENSKDVEVNHSEDDKLNASEKQTSAFLAGNSSVRCRKKVYKRRLKFGTGAHTDPLKSILQTSTETTDATTSISKDAPLVSLCLALGLLARRSLATASHSSLSGVEFFLHGLHALFKGDFRITSPRDEWVFADMELLHGVVAPAVKMALKLHQDHFSSPDEYLDPSILYEAMSSHTKELVISHEADPIWRSAVLRGAPNLLALRHVMEDGSDEYRIIRLTKRFLSFRVIKLNRECVRGLWAGQQQELIYLRNRNPERGSIQNAKQALRNIINSSCDQPIGYPIYVSPLTTSYADTNEQICRIIGGAITFESIKGLLLESWRRIRERCREGCSSGSGGFDCDGTSGANEAPVVYFSPTVAANTTGTLSYGSQSLSGTGTRGSLASMNKPNSSTLLTTFLKRDMDQEREVSRDIKTNNSCIKKNQGQSVPAFTSKERDRRATLPITSTRLSMNGHDFVLKDSVESSQSGGLNKLDFSDTVINSIKNNKISNSFGNLEVFDGKINSNIGIENFKCGDYSTVDDFDRMKSFDEYEGYQIDDNLVKDDTFCRVHIIKDQINYPLIELNRKAIIVDGLEIYDCLDLGRRIDVIWPNEKMRSNGGRSTWQDWSPQEGMVGFVRHYWQPNHPDARFRSNVNGTLYLIEINDHYVPVGECGVREYNQIYPAEQSLSTNVVSAATIMTTSESNQNYNSVDTITQSTSGLNKDNLVIATSTIDPIASSLALALKSFPNWEKQSPSLVSSVPTGSRVFSSNADILINNNVSTNSSEYCGSLDIKPLNSFYLNFQFQKPVKFHEGGYSKRSPCFEDEQRTKKIKNFKNVLKLNKSGDFTDDYFGYEIEEKLDNVIEEELLFDQNNM